MEFLSYKFLFVTLFLVVTAGCGGQAQAPRPYCRLPYSLGICVTSDECQDGENASACSSDLVCCHSSRIQSTTTSPLDVEPVDSGNAVCGRRHPNGLDVRSLEYSIFGEFPWTIAVLSDKLEDGGEWNDRTLLGGGSLIGERAVLTAAHTLYKHQEVPLKVRAGEGNKDLNDLFDYVESPVQSIILHENFNNVSLDNDIALLILKNPIKANINIGFACIPGLDERAPVGEECYATGWGKETLGGSLQDNMKKTKLRIVQRQECIRSLRQSRLGPFYMLPRSVICALGQDEEDTCKGDGGGPVVCQIPGTQFYYKQFGITSFGVDCGNENPGAYTNVVAFRQWIDNKMRNSGLPTSTYVYAS